MISPKICSAIESVRPMLNPEITAAFTARVAGRSKDTLSLGRLDELALHYALIRGSADNVLRRKGLIVFAADHGVAAEICSDGAERTLGAVHQFLRGGSAAQVMCRHAGIEPLLINVGLAGEEEPGGLNFPIASGTRNIAQFAAMTEAETNAALEIGLRLAAEAAVRFDVVGLGQIGEGGSLAAAALLSALGGRDAAETTLQNPEESAADYLAKVQVVRSAVARHRVNTVSHFGSLQTLGGLDIAAMTGFLLGAACHRLPVVIDGFAAGAAALVARAMAPDSLDAMIFSYRNPGAAHTFLLQFLAVDPVFDLQISDAGGLGSAIAIQALESAIVLNREIIDLSVTG